MPDGADDGAALWTAATLSFPIGTAVMLTGLVGRADLNGCEGVVVSHNTNQRIGIKVSTTCDAIHALGVCPCSVPAHFTCNAFSGSRCVGELTFSAIITVTGISASSALRAAFASTGSFRRSNLTRRACNAFNRLSLWLMAAEGLLM